MRGYGEHVEQLTINTTVKVIRNFGMGVTPLVIPEPTIVQLTFQSLELAERTKAIISVGTYCTVVIDTGHDVECHCESTTMVIRHGEVTRSEWKSNEYATFGKWYVDILTPVCDQLSLDGSMYLDYQDLLAIVQLVHDNINRMQKTAFDD